MASNTILLNMDIQFAANRTLGSVSISVFPSSDKDMLKIFIFALLYPALQVMLIISLFICKS